jgi:glutamate/aspartate transport system permease protein
MATWDWQVFCKDTIDGEVRPRCFGEGGDITYLDWLLSAWGWTLSVALLALVVALVVGSVMGIFRTTPSKALVAIGNAWTELFRNIPLLVQVFLWYHVLPALVPALKDFPSFILVVFALGFFTSARIAEQVRAGIQSLPKGQRYAGLAMGLTLPQTYRYVLLPMAFRIVIPPLTSETMNLIKNSSIALTIGLAELTFRSREMGEYTFNFFEAFTAATLIYIAIAMTANRVMAYVERRVAVPGYIGGGK